MNVIEKRGRELDWYMRKLITPGKKSKDDYPPRSGVAILTYAYLLAFAVLGYEYILDPALEKIRSQFDSPDTIQTNWLQYAYVDLSGPEQPGGIPAAIRRSATFIRITAMAVPY